MPYNRDGSHKKNPSKRDWASYHRSKRVRSHSSPSRGRKDASGGKTGGASIGGGSAASS